MSRKHEGDWFFKEIYNPPDGTSNGVRSTNGRTLTDTGREGFPVRNGETGGEVGDKEGTKER